MNEMNSKIQLCSKNLAEKLQLTIDLPVQNEGNQPVRIAVIGQPTQNLFGVLSELFDGLEPLNTMILRSYHCIIRYGEAREYAVFKGSERFPVSAETLAAKLGEFATIPEMLECEFTLESDLLKNHILEVIASYEDFEDVDLPETLSSAHFFLFTLSSTALLSIAERKALRRILPYKDACLGILLTQDNLVPDESRKDIDASLDSFLEGAARVYRMPETDADAIRSLLDDLSARSAGMEEKRLQRASLIQLSELLQMAQSRVEVLSFDAEQLNDAIETMSAKAKLLPSRQESACRRARMQYIAKLKLDMNERVSSFQQQLLEKLSVEIDKADNIDDLPELLPHYVSDHWNALMEGIKK